MKRFIIAIMLLFGSCSYRVEKDPNVLIQHFNADPGTLNPILVSDSYGMEIGGYIYESLIELDNETLEYRPLLAERWSISDNHLQFTFYLRKNVKWHDGVPFTADDVIYTYKQIQNPKVDAATRRVSFQDVEKVEKLDDYTVRFTYKRPYFRAFLVCGGIQVIPKHIFDDGTDFNEHPANRKPIGTGPFIFKEWKTKRKVVLEKNPNYWKKPPGINGIVFRIIEDPTVSFQELKKGETDFSEIRAIQWERGAKSKAFEKRFNKAEFYLPNFSYIAWNLKKPYFEDKRVRHALSMLINKEAILKRVLFGHAVIVEGEEYYFSKAYDHSIKTDPYDPAAAAKLLDEAGWVDIDGDSIRDKNGVPFKFDFYYVSTSMFATQLVTMLREDLLKNGIKMELRGLEFNALGRVIDERSFDAITLAWSVPLTNDPYQLWHSTQVTEGSNMTGFANAEADEVIEKIRVEFNDDVRSVLYKRLQKILHDEQPYTFLFNSATLAVYDKRFTNVKLYKIGLDIREWGVNTAFAY